MSQKRGNSSVGKKNRRQVSLDQACWHIAQLSGWQRAVTGVGAGALSALALPPLGYVVLMVIGFTLLVVLMDGCAVSAAGSPLTRRQKLAKAARTGWLFGFGYFFVGLYWIGFALLVDAETYAWMIPFVVVLVPAGLALFTAGATALASLVWSSGPERIASLAIFWVLFEWLRGHILTGFPWNLVGYAWAGSDEIIQITALIGIYGLSLVTVLVCSSPAVVAAAGGRHGAGFLTLVGAMAVVAAMWAGGAWRLSSQPTEYVDDVRIRIVQPSIPQSEKWQPGNGPRIFSVYMELTQREGYDEISHVMWPESAVPYILSRDRDRLDAIGRMLGPERILITGAVRYDLPDDQSSPVFFNSLHVIQAQDQEEQLTGEIIATYDKQHLVPFGEYLPLAGLLSRLGFRQLAEGASGYASGPGTITLDVAGAPPASPLICYEIIFPGEATAPGRRPGWLMNLTNDAWFGDSSGPRQHLDMARVRAIETGLPVVRAANNGISTIIDPLGRTAARLALNEVGILDGGLPRALAPTLYDKYGDRLVLFLLFCLSGYVWFARQGKIGLGGTRPDG